MYSLLLATAFNQFRNRPCAGFNPGRLGRCHPNRKVRLAEVVSLRQCMQRLAELVELNPRTIQKIEAGETNILVTTLIRFQRALRCPWPGLLE
jgi:hypothetical protein